MRITSAEEAVRVIKSNDRVFVHGAVATPVQLILAMTARAAELRDVEIVHLHTEGPAPYASIEYAENFRTNCLFVAANVREAVNEGLADYVPVFLSEVPGLFRKGIMPLDVALVQVSPPDRHGFCSLGVSVDVARAAVQVARHVIAQINPNMPRTHGDGLIHISNIDSAVVVDDPLPEISPGEPGPVETAIGRYVAELVEDGATLQMGIGGIPNAVLAALRNHRDLGIHTEMFSDGAIDLIERGIVNNEKKRIHPGKVVSSFAMGTRRMYDYIDDNPQVVLLDVAYVNDTAVIRRNPRVTAINSAIEVDLTGQVGADSVGIRQYSGVGGQMDFVRGAALSEGGKPIIALPSATSKGVSRIAPYLRLGSGVVTTRAHVHYVVTEYGIAYLYGKNLRQRARALIDIAHPDRREELEKMAWERFKRWPEHVLA
ncbi:MAG: acetyl-CoA hydrolase/transferase C-terminal domain-containing protein [Caldilinea sp.]|uniref:acetyl-CoA hydrolase/transferase family protein n=1 Tax=Caldilinea sp. TaxID=2293560 RepID=UPI002CFF07BC|nr:acetyl-CoA hydrolase/transferase family protein [Anaerolineales bacterium]HQY94170.1 acetyl-CoA hydrolase/transferase C-terminal domain-containing protein [Caldilinea sp.]